MGLRKGQKELVELYRGGYCAVPAIPGGGKTHCLSLWAAEMIQQGLHRPGKILIVTYMNSAVNNFRQRIAKELEKRGISGEKDFFVSTIHSLCLQIIKDKPELAGAGEEFEVLDDQSRNSLIYSAVGEWRYKNENRFRLHIDERYLKPGNENNTCSSWQDRLCSIVSSAAGSFKSRGISGARAVEECSSLGEGSLLKACAEIYEVYDRKLKASGCLDFDDMLQSARGLLEEDAVLLKAYRERFTFVCEDEAQDSNLIQSEILRMIAGDNLLRVGDSNQAICGSFTSSDFKYFRDFCSLPETTVYSITQSSRSSKDIIGLANHFVEYIRSRHPVEACRQSLLPQYIEPVDPGDPFPNPSPARFCIRLGIFGSWEEEVKSVIAEATKVLRQFPEKTLSILVPTSYKMNDFVKYMDYLGLPYELLENTSKERNRALRILGRTLDYLSAPGDGRRLADLVCEYLLEKKEIPGAGNESLQVWARDREALHTFLAGCRPEELFYPVDGNNDSPTVLEFLPGELKNTGPAKSLVKAAAILKELLELPLMPVEKLILHIGLLMEFNREETAIAHKVADDLRYLVQREPGYGLEELASELLKQRSLFSYFAGMVWELRGYVPKPGCITLSTYHKAKGLEWDVVFLTALDNSDFPVTLSDRFLGEYWYLKEEFKNPQAVIKAELQSITGAAPLEDPVLKAKLETISERARLLYVGITRAKEYLFASGFHSNKGKRNEIQPSAYLLEIKRFIEERRGGNG